MNDFLMLWLSLSLSGSIAALALILLTPILRRFGKTWQYYLWLLAVLRLLIPYSSDVNIVGSLFQQAESHLTAQYTPEEDFLKLNQPDLTKSPNMPDTVNNIRQNSSTAADPFSWNDYAGSVIWLTVAVILLLRKVYGYKQLTNAVRKGGGIIDNGQLSDVLQTVSSTMGIKKRIPLCTNPLVRAPMIIGGMKPMIVLPARQISISELTYIFRHELTHYRRKDFLYKWLVEITVCLHWFNPFVYWMRNRINKDCEFSCDEAVVSRLGADNRKIYGDALLNSIDINHTGRKDVVSLSLNEDVNLLKERLYAIIRYKRKSVSDVCIAAFLTSLLFCGTVFAGAHTFKNINAGSRSFEQYVSEQQPAADPVPSITGTVLYDHVEMRRYEGEGGHPYIHNVKINNTTQKIVGCQRGMVAFDKEGSPLKIDWWSLDSELNSTYFYLYENASSEIAAAGTDDEFGGWSLNLMGRDLAAAKIAYVLYCDKEITFDDGTVWINPDFDNWRAAYEGKKIDAADLENYYPYEHNIEF